MEHAGEIAIVDDLASLEVSAAAWDTPEKNTPIGIIVSLEGADPIVRIDQLERLKILGLRALGPAHYGPGRYANGTNATGGLPDCGRELIREMDRLGADSGCHTPVR